MSQTPGLLFTEERVSAPLSLALTLFDAVTGEAPIGLVNVEIAGQAAPMQKAAGTFLFFNLPDGAHTVNVNSDPLTPYYLPVAIAITTPIAAFPYQTSPTTSQQIFWPAYPQLSLADATKLLSDPSQPAAYLAQRTLAGLNPTPQYPFPPGMTMVRGTVWNTSAGALSPAPGATVKCADPIAQTATDANGEFVLLFNSLTTTTGGTTVPVTSRTVTLTATLAALTATVQVLVARGLTASTTLNFTS